MGGVVWLRAAASGSQMGWKLSSVGTCATFHASSSSLLLRVLKRITRMQNCPADIRMFYFLFWYCLVTTLTLNLGGGRWDGRWEGGWGGERGGGGGGGASPSNDGWQFLQFTDRTKFAGGSKKRRIHLTGEEWSGREDFEEKKSFFLWQKCWLGVEQKWLRGKIEKDYIESIGYWQPMDSEGCIRSTVLGLLHLLGNTMTKTNKTTETNTMTNTNIRSCDSC